MSLEWLEMLLLDELEVCDTFCSKNDINQIPPIDPVLEHHRPREDRVQIHLARLRCGRHTSYLTLPQ